MKDINKEFKPSTWAINNRTAVFMLTIIITLAGLSTYNNLPKESFPEIVLPKIFISTIYPGTSPENMENLVTKPIEKKMKSNLKKWTEELDIMFDIYNSAWEANWGFVPMTKDEFYHTAKDLKSIVDPELVHFALVDGVVA